MWIRPVFPDLVTYDNYFNKGNDFTTDKSIMVQHIYTKRLLRYVCNMKVNYHIIGNFAVFADDRSAAKI